MSKDEPALDVESIVRAVGVVHPPASVCARLGRPTVIDDGFARLELRDSADGWRWRKGRKDRPLRDLQELLALLRAMADVYALEPLDRRAQAEQYVDALRVRWLQDAAAAPPPRLWGLCAPGRPPGAGGPRAVLYDAQHPITSDQIAAEVERLHPAAHVCFEKGWPTLVHDGSSWLMFFDWQSMWRWSLDGEVRGLVRDYLALQVVLAEQAAVYAALDEERRQRAVEHVGALSQLPLPERYERAREHAGRGRPRHAS